MTVGELINELNKYDNNLLVEMYNGYDDKEYDISSIQLCDNFGVSKSVLIK